MRAKPCLLYTSLAQLVATALVVFGLVLVAGSFAASRLAERESVNDAAHTANLLAVAVVQPALTDELLTGDAAAYAAFDKVCLLYTSRCV